jgi:hypothetical protein
MTGEPDLIFRKDLYFYQMVSAAAVSFTGSVFVLELQRPAVYGPKDYIALPGIVTGDRHFRPHDVRSEAIAGNVSRNDFLGTVCMMLVNTAYESVKDRNDGSPTFEFFRHVRNASSHLNQANANPLQGDFCFGKMLGTADVFALLWDVEQIIASQPGQSQN